MCLLCPCTLQCTAKVYKSRQGSLHYTASDGTQHCCKKDCSAATGQQSCDNLRMLPWQPVTAHEECRPVLPWQTKRTNKGRAALPCNNIQCTARCVFTLKYCPAGLQSDSKPVALPDMESQLSQLSQSVSLLLSGKPTPADMQRADACLQVIHGLVARTYNGRGRGCCC